MDPSSLIFVVIVAIWAVYLLGHWVRRRDMLATARSVDRFSEAMRVLERRLPQPVAAPRSRSYVVARHRPPEPVATARVASEADSGSTHRAPGSIAAPSAATAALTPGPNATSSANQSAGPGSAPSKSTAAVRGEGLATDRPAGRRGSGRPATGRPAGRPSGRPDAAAHRARALVLLALLVLVPAGWVLTAVTAMPAWVPTVLTVALVGHVLRLRRVAMRRSDLERRRPRADRADRAARARAGSGRPERGSGPGRGPAGSEPGRGSASRGGPQAHRGRPQPSSPAESARSVSTDAGADSARFAAHPGSVDVAEDSRSSTDDRHVRTPGSSASDQGGRRAAPDEVHGTAAGPSPSASPAPTSEHASSTAPASEHASRAVATVEPDADFAAPPGDGTAMAAAAGSGWQPVPVPPPTYTLKPKAPAPVQRPAPAGDREPARPAKSAASGSASEEAGADAGFDLDRILERRIAAGG